MKDLVKKVNERYKERRTIVGGLKKNWNCRECGRKFWLPAIATVINPQTRRCPFCNSMRVY